MKHSVTHWAMLLVVVFAMAAQSATTLAEEGLIAHWPLVADGRDISGNGLHATVHAVDGCLPMAGWMMYMVTF
jgi:hypothetical protein